MTLNEKWNITTVGKQKNKKRKWHEIFNPVRKFQYPFTHKAKMSLRESFKSRLSNLSQNISQSSVVNAAKQKVSSVTHFVEQVVASEPQQFIEAQELGIYYITDRVLGMWHFIF